MADKVWTIIKLLNWTEQYFRDKGVENPRLDAEILLCDVLRCQRIRLYVNFDQPLTAEELAAYRSHVQRRGRWEPLAYILGHREFMAYDFKVRPGVLIPRPETELLVEQVAKFNEKKDNVRILDIGCGSGAIIISLLKLLPGAQGTAVDISPTALQVTRENAEQLGVSERLTLVKSNLFGGLKQDEKYSVIVSNPPYIPTKVIPTLAADVRQEPREALDGGRDGLDFYRRIIAAAPQYLAGDGLLAFEIGDGQGNAVSTLCRAAGFAVVQVLKDYAEQERIVLASKG